MPVNHKHAGFRLRRARGVPFFIVYGTGHKHSPHYFREVMPRGLPIHLVNHLATIADLHRAGRYDRMSDDVLTLTGQRPLSLQEFVRRNAAKFTASAKAA